MGRNRGVDRNPPEDVWHYVVLYACRPTKLRAVDYGGHYKLLITKGSELSVPDFPFFFFLFFFGFARSFIVRPSDLRVRPSEQVHCPDAMSDPSTAAANALGAAVAPPPPPKADGTPQPVATGRMCTNGCGKQAGTLECPKCQASVPYAPASSRPPAPLRCHRPALSAFTRCFSSVRPT